MKKTTESVERYGKKWYWCPKHVVPGTYDGLYVTHKPEDHDEWKRKRDNWSAKTKGNDSKPSDEPQKQVGKETKLAFTDTLKAALLTRCDLTDAQADALIKEVQEESDF